MEVIISFYRSLTFPYQMIPSMFKASSEEYSLDLYYLSNIFFLEDCRLLERFA